MRHIFTIIDEIKIYIYIYISNSLLGVSNDEYSFVFSYMTYLIVM